MMAYGVITVFFEDINQQQASDQLYSIIGLSLILGLFGVVIMLLSIKRFHDMNRSGWFAILMLIPILNLAVGLFWLGFVMGTEGENRYGDDPVMAIKKN